MDHQQQSNTMATITNNNNMTTTAMKSTLKCLHNEWRHFGQLKHDEAANEVLDFIKAVAAHDVCYGLTVKKQTQCNCLAKLSSLLDDGHIFCCLETHKMLKANQKKTRDTTTKSHS